MYTLKSTSFSYRSFMTSCANTNVDRGAFETVVVYCTCSALRRTWPAERLAIGHGANSHRPDHTVRARFVTTV